MEQLKEKNGLHLQGTLETGRTIKRMSLESKFIRMEINMKVCGRKTSVMDRELTGRMQEVNLRENTPVTGLKMKDMEEGPYSAQMETGMMDFGFVVSPKVKVE